MFNIYISRHGQLLATFKPEGITELAQLLAPMLTDSLTLKAGFTNQRGLRVSIGRTQKQGKKQALTIVDGHNSLKWADDDSPFNGDYDSIGLALSNAILQTRANFLRQYGVAI